jgi:hypothetical protein
MSSKELCVKYSTLDTALKVDIENLNKAKFNHGEKRKDLYLSYLLTKKFRPLKNLKTLQQQLDKLIESDMMECTERENGLVQRIDIYTKNLKDFKQQLLYYEPFEHSVDGKTYELRSSKKMKTYTKTNFLKTFVGDQEHQKWKSQDDFEKDIKTYHNYDHKELEILDRPAKKIRL